MVEYQYKWKQIGEAWKCVPASPCPECGAEEFAQLVSPEATNVIPLTSASYKRTEECFACGFIETEETMTEEEFEVFADDNDIPR